MPDFTSYDMIVKWLGKGKKRSEGRRKRAFMFRMADDVVIVAHCRRAYPVVDNKLWKLTDFAELRSNNVLTFTRDSADMVPIAASVSMCLSATLGLGWHRKGKGIYVVFPWETDHRNYWMQFNGPHAYEHFKGMSWDLNVHRCFNPRIPILKSVDADQRKIWAAQLKKFKRAFLTRAKLGIVDKVIEEYNSGGKANGFVSALTINDTTLEAIKAGDVTNDYIMQVVACRANTGWRPIVSRTSVCNMVNTIINRNSIRYRQEFGVLRK